MIATGIDYCRCGGVTVDIVTGTVPRCDFCGKEKNVRIYKYADGYGMTVVTNPPPPAKKKKDWKSIPVTSHDRKREWWNHK